MGNFLKPYSDELPVFTKRQAYPYEVRQEFDQRIFARYALQAGEMEWLEAPALGRIVIKTGLEFEGRRLSL